MANVTKVTIKSHVPEVKAEFDAAIWRALYAIGATAEGHAKEGCPVDTGRLRNSITHKEVQSEKAVYIGTNVKYGKYVELGTGIYASNGNGRKTPWWVYPDGAGKYKTPFLTHGIHAVHFLRDAASKSVYVDEYKTLLKQALQDKA